MPYSSFNNLLNSLSSILCQSNTYRDKARSNSDPGSAGAGYRLFGVDDNGGVFFYRSDAQGEYAGYFGPSSDGFWGTLDHRNQMNPKSRVFIQNIEMVRKLERFKIMRPCGHCQRAEYKIRKKGVGRICYWFTNLEIIVLHPLPFIFLSRRVIRTGQTQNPYRGESIDVAYRIESEPVSTF